MEQVKYTIINHNARVELGLTPPEYCVADLIYNTSNIPGGDGWCSFSKIWMAEQLGVTKRGINKVINKLIEKGLVEKKDGKVNRSVGSHLRITIDWYQVVYMKVGTKVSKGGNIVPEGGNKSVKRWEQTGHETRLYNDINNDSYNVLPKKNKTSGIIGEEEISAPPKLKNTIGYLSSVPEEDISHWIEKFPVLSREIIIREAGKAKAWTEANGKRKKDYQAFLRNWLDNTAERLEKQKGGGYGPRVSVQE